MKDEWTKYSIPVKNRRGSRTCVFLTWFRKLSNGRMLVVLAQSEESDVSITDAYEQAALAVAKSIGAVCGDAQLMDLLTNITWIEHYSESVRGAELGESFCEIGLHWEWGPSGILYGTHPPQWRVVIREQLESYFKVTIPPCHDSGAQPDYSKKAHTVHVTLVHSSMLGYSDEQSVIRAQKELAALEAAARVAPVSATIGFGNIIFLNEFRIAMNNGRIDSLIAVYNGGIVQHFDGEGRSMEMWPEEMSIYKSQLDQLLYQKLEGGNK